MRYLIWSNCMSLVRLRAAINSAHKCYDVTHDTGHGAGHRLAYVLQPPAATGLRWSCAAAQREMLIIFCTLFCVKYAYNIALASHILFISVINSETNSFVWNICICEIYQVKRKYARNRRIGNPLALYYVIVMLVWLRWICTQNHIHYMWCVTDSGK